MSRRLKVQPVLALLFDKGDQSKRFLEEEIYSVYNSKVSRLDEQKVRQELSDGDLRINYDDVSGECLGLLIEEGQLKASVKKIKPYKEGTIFVSGIMPDVPEIKTVTWGGTSTSTMTASTNGFLKNTIFSLIGSSTVTWSGGSNPSMVSNYNRIVLFCSASDKLSVLINDTVINLTPVINAGEEFKVAISLKNNNEVTVVVNSIEQTINTYYKNDYYSLLLGSYLDDTYDNFHSHLTSFIFYSAPVRTNILKLKTKKSIL